METTERFIAARSNWSFSLFWPPSVAADSMHSNFEISNGEAMGSRTCSWCGVSGHDKRSCTVSQFAGQCSVCTYHGHDKRNCPDK